MLPPMRGMQRRGHFSGRDWVLYGIVVTLVIAAAGVVAYLWQ